MPTAFEYEQAAAALRTSLVTLGASRRHVESASDANPIRGGPVAAICDTTLVIAQANIDRVAHQIEALAEVCDRRAIVCAEHAADLAVWARQQEIWERAMLRYQAARNDPEVHVPWPGNPASRPVAPYAWVEPR